MHMDVSDMHMHVALFRQIQTQSTRPNIFVPGGTNNCKINFPIT